jgi:hypothetical protein
VWLSSAEDQLAGRLVLPHLKPGVLLGSLAIRISPPIRRQSGCP